MKVLRKIIEIDEELCNGCGECVPSCAEAALVIVDGKAKMLGEKYCDGLGACLGNCPQGALRIIEREADDFDEEAVEELLRRQKKKEQPVKAAPPPMGGCPSAGLQSFRQSSPCKAANAPVSTGGGASALGHWPVQIRLVPPSAPFLKNADLLVAADCTPVAYPDFHKDFLEGRAIMMGCPKFDDVEGYVNKFQEVFETAGIKSIKMLIMEVPCCSQMRGIIAEALKRSGRDIPVSETVISVRGEVVA
ncbi:MAG: 4Fe-4S binding protein [Proteobacteria bacterium]|nr:4Fe-4S binding protein [Pseudomonadota bacterium]MBU1739394.1 4Fe-4S binding protein [Pseudomonadota bacterium]